MCNISIMYIVPDDIWPFTLVVYLEFSSYPRWGNMGVALNSQTQKIAPSHNSATNTRWFWGIGQGNGRLWIYFDSNILVTDFLTDFRTFTNEQRTWTTMAIILYNNSEKIGNVCITHFQTISLMNTDFCSPLEMSCVYICT